MPAVNLSTINTDADAILAQLQAAVQQRDTWRDFVTSGTGETLLELQAGCAALNGYSSESALQEAMLLFAKNDSSVYAYTAGQGVRIGRKNPASCTVTLTRTDVSATQSVPQYSQFSAGGAFLFNRVSIVFPIGTATVTATLYQGKVVNRTVFGIGEDFQSWISSEKDFTVSDTDVMLLNNGVAVPVVQDGLWNYSGASQAAVQDVTTPKGHLHLKFGSQLYGLAPTVNANLSITYAVTDGQAGNDSNFSGTTFTFSTLQCASLSGLSGGTDEKPASLYKATTPALWGAHDTAVTGNQYHAIASQYPGVLDIRWFAQRELSVTDPRYMNLFKAVVLTTTPWTTTDQANFVTWFKARSMYSGVIYFEDPQPRNVDVAVDVYINNTADPETIRAKAVAAVTALFAKRFGFLNTNIYRFDIAAALYSCDEAVKFADLKAPTTDIYVGLRSPVVTATAGSDGTGGLVPGSYSYAVTSISSTGGETFAPFESVQLLGYGHNTLAWIAVPGAVNYKIYQRINNVGVIGLLATVSASTTSYIDYGGAPSTTLLYPSVDTSGVWYANLNSVAVNVLFSDRVSSFNSR